MASPAPSVLAAAIWTQVSVVFAFVVMHFWARFERRGVSLDDWLMLASWVRARRRRSSRPPPLWIASS